jgi:putative DNA primase/helicase
MIINKYLNNNYAGLSFGLAILNFSSFASSTDTTITEPIPEAAESLDKPKIFSGPNTKFNTWKLAEGYQEDNPNLYYSTEQKIFYTYSGESHIWTTLNEGQVKNAILVWIKVTYPKTYTKFMPNSTTDIIVLLQQKEINMVKIKSELNKEGFLLPFKNGVLNCKTLELKPHAKELYTTHIIGVEYNKNAVLKDTPMSEFLACLVNNNAYALNVLRMTLYLIFTNTLIYQVALYIYGPGGTGKSTFTNILLYLFGPAASVSTSLNMISSRFGAHLLQNKLLLIINELPLILGSEPSIIKSITGGDSIMNEEKYKTPTQFVPNLFVIITSNSLWNLKNATSAMARRFIYLPFNKKPVNRNNDLFNLQNGGYATGILVEHLPALIRWALTCPKGLLAELNDGGENITEKINPDSRVRTNPVKIWALENLEPDTDSKIFLGSHKKETKMLYGNFLAWSDKYSTEIGTVKPSQFSALLLDTLNSLNWVVNKKRINTGTVITGIKFRETANYLEGEADYNGPLDFNITEPEKLET